MEVTFDIGKVGYVMPLPLPPSQEIPFSEKQSMFLFETATKGKLNLPGEVDPLEFPLEGRFPGQVYNWMDNVNVYDPMVYVRVFQIYRKVKKAFHVVITEGDTVLIDKYFHIAEFTWKSKRNRDITYSMHLVEAGYGVI